MTWPDTDTATPFQLDLSIFEKLITSRCEKRMAAQESADAVAVAPKTKNLSSQVPGRFLAKC
jgi:hypothetical protein